MPKFPRIVIGSVSPQQDDPVAMTLALMAALRRDGYEVQHFRSVAAFTPIDYVTPLAGIASRHLDPWIMSESLCRELFAHSAAAVDVSLIESGPAELSTVVGEGAGTSWTAIAAALDAPVLGVVRSQPSESFHRLPLPDGLDGLLLDGFPSREHFEKEKTWLEGMTGLRVVGGLAAGPAATDCIGRMRSGKGVPESALADLTRRVLEATDLGRLTQLARARPFPSYESELFAAPPPPRDTVRVAVAYDECFHCYFPDTLDALEFLGADLRVFSPLTDERLPDDADIVYMGCGHPEAHLDELAENECMRASLRGHVSAGKRLYAEGGAAAYLCRQLRLPDGRTVAALGILAADAEFTGNAPSRAQPVELKCQRSTWLAERGATIRGYRSAAWRFNTFGDRGACFSSNGVGAEGMARHHGVGSTAHLNFAAQPRVLRSFFAAHAPSLCI
jgi:cobyrinic acid a,c-diamide synthase